MEKAGSQKFTHFIGIPIYSQIDQVMDKMINQLGDVADLLQVQKGRLHVTFILLILENQEQIDKVGEIFQRLLNKAIEENPQITDLEFQVKGIDFFSNRQKSLSNVTTLFLDFFDNEMTQILNKLKYNVTLEYAKSGFIKVKQAKAGQIQVLRQYYSIDTNQQILKDQLYHCSLFTGQKAYDLRNFESQIQNINQYFQENKTVFKITDLQLYRLRADKSQLFYISDKHFDFKRQNLDPLIQQLQSISLSEQVSNEKETNPGTDQVEETCKKQLN